MPRPGFPLFLLCALLGGCAALAEGCNTVPLDPNIQDPDPPSSDTSCREQRRQVALSADTEFGVPNDVVRWIQGFHTGALHWVGDGTTTSIEIEAWDPRAYYVKSVPAPDYVPETQDRLCASHVEVVVQVSLHTTDERLQESAELSLRKYGDVEAFGTLYFAWDRLVGSYKSSAPASRCFQGLRVKVLLGDTGFSGSLSEDLTVGSCAQATAAEHRSSFMGHWGMRWQSY